MYLYKWNQYQQRHLTLYVLSVSDIA